MNENINISTACIHEEEKRKNHGPVPLCANTSHILAYTRTVCAQETRTLEEVLETCTDKQTANTWVRRDNARLWKEGKKTQ